MTEAYVSIQEAATHFNVHDHTIRGLIRDGKINAIQINSHYRVKISDIENKLQVIKENQNNILLG